MEYRLQDLVDIEMLQKLLDRLHDMIPLASSVVDMEGEFLVNCPAQDICIKFHKHNEKSRAVCKESDRRACRAVIGKRENLIYPCPLGLEDCVTPIYIGATQVGALLCGQVFVEPPDESRFREQARHYGFDEAAYIEALRRVPIVSREELDRCIALFGVFTGMLGQLGLERMRELEAKNALAQSNDRLRVANNYNRSLIEASIDAMAVIAPDGSVADVNRATERLTGRSREQLTGSPAEILSLMDIAFPRPFRVDGGETRLTDFETAIRHSDGHLTPVQVNSTSCADEGGGQGVLLITAHDLTHRRWNEEQISRAEQFRLLADNSTDVIVRLTPEGICTYASPVCRRVLGYEPEEMVGQSIMNFFHPSDRLNYLRTRKTISANGRQTFVFNFRGRVKDNGYTWFEASGQTLFDKEGEPTEVQASVRDISVRKRAEEELKKSADEISDLYNNAPCGYHSLDRDGRYLRVNDTELRWLGYTREELVGKLRVTDLMSERARKKFLEQYPTLIKSGRMHDIDMEYVRKDGTLLPVLVSAVCVYDEAGNFLMDHATLYDITERRRAEEELVRAKEYAEEIINTATAVMLVLDADCRVVEFNHAAEKLTGYKKAEIVGRNCFETLVPRERYPEVWEKFRNLSSGAVPSRNENPILTKAGEERHIAWNNSLLRTDGRVTGVVCFGMDVTERIRMEHELKAYKERLDIVLKNVDAAIFQLDGAGVYTLAEGRALARAGMPRRETLGRAAEEVLSGFAPALNAARQALSGKRSTAEYAVGDAVFEQIFTPYTAPDGRHDGVIGLAVDITERKRAEQRIYEEKERLRVTLQSIGDGVIATDGAGRVELMNGVAEELTGWRSNQAVGLLFNDIFDLYNEVTGERCANPVEKVLATGKIVGLGNHTALRARNGAVRSIADSAAPILDSAHRILGVILVFRDVTDAKKKENEITFLSYHDRLTGLYNRTFLEEEQRRLDTERQLPISVIMGDVNGLKLTNDVFGHAEGDSLLVRIAHILHECCRNEDIVARVGGDEFCILLPKTGYASASDICKRIYARCDREDYGGPAGGAKLSISIGFSTKTDAGESLTNVTKAAEDLMYRRKLLESRSQHSFIISSIRMTLFEKSYETEQHAQRLIANSKAIAQALNLPDDQVNDVELFALLHDIGKIAIDSRILTKTGPLDDTEWQEMRRHPEIGFRIAQASPELAHIAEYILCHHERWDGTGYPQGLKGTAIPLLARIMLVVDAYDAMTQDRIYRKAMSREAACTELLKNAGTQFDPNIVWVFMECLEHEGKMA